MAFAKVPAPAEPMGELNTTPLIDVMLVLLVMFIITIPIASHQISVDLPSRPAAGITLSPVFNSVAVTAEGDILWNARRISRAQLEVLLQRAAALDPEPELRLAPAADASYATVAQVIATIDRSPVSNFGFVGNERFGRFSRD